MRAAEPKRNSTECSRVPPGSRSTAVQRYRLRWPPRDDMDSWRPRYHMPTVASSNKMASLDSLDEFVSFVTGNLMGFNIGAIGL